MTQPVNNALRLNEADNVAVVLQDIKVDEAIRIADVVEPVIALKAIPYGHKIAIRAIAKNERIIKYGECMGIATDDIALGDHAHVHNIRGLELEEHLAIRRAALNR